MFFKIIAYSFLPLLFAYLLLHEFVYLLWYRYEAKRRNCAVPQYIEKSFPLGIRRIIRLLKLAKSYKLLEVQTNELFAKTEARTLLRQAPLTYQIFTIDPENIKAVLATSFSDFSLGIRYRQLSPVFGDGIFTLSGEGWKHSRAMLRPQFARDQVARVDQISDHAKAFIRAIERHQSRDNYINIQHYFHLLTMDTATEFLFGKSIESLNPEKQPTIVTRSGEIMSADDFVESYTFLNNYAFKRAVLSKLYWTQNSKEFQEHRRRAQAFIDFYVDRALNATSLMEKEDGEKSESAKVFVFAMELAKITRDPIVIRDQIFNVLIAGRDTTASTLSFAVYYLTREPEIFKKLKEEVIKLFGTEEDEKPLTFVTLKQAPYMRYFINEVLRLTPILPLNFREAVRDTILPTGGGTDGTQPVLVPKGVPVVYSVFSMHRDPKLWGPDANEFKPERWENLKLDNLWSYLPFNGGPRICLGQQFALTEISVALVRLLQHFNSFEKGPQFPDEPRLMNSLTMMNAPPGVIIRLS